MTSDWKELALGEITELVIDYRGKTPKKLGGDWSESGYRALSAKNIKTGRIVQPDTIRYIDEEMYRKWMKDEVQRGDILITSEAPFGQIFFWDSDEKIVLSQRLFCVRIKPDYDARFIYYYMTTPEFQGELDGRATGTTVVGLRQPELMKCVIRCPEIQEQKAIAAILSSIDAKIIANEKINDNLLAQMQLLYQNLLDSCVCSPIRLEEVSQKIAMGPFGSNIKVSTFVPDGVPIISGNHLRSVFLEEPSYNYITEEHAQKLKNSMVYPRDIVFTHAGNIGQVAMIPQGSDYPYYMISQRQFYMRCDETKVIPELVLFFFHSREGKGKLLANANSTGVPSIAQPSTHLKNIEMSMPNKADQDEWYKTIKPMVDMYVALCQENKRLISLRDSLLPHLMSGELDVSAIQL